MKKALEEALPANISELVDLPRYNLMMAKELASTWEGNAVSERLVTSMREHVLEFVKSHEVPKYIKASDLWAAFIAEHEEEAVQEGWESPAALMQYSEYGSFMVGLEKAPEENSSFSSRSRSKDHAFQFENNLYFTKQITHEGRETVDVLHDGKPVWRLFSGALEGDALGKKVHQFRGNFEKLVAALYYGDSLLVLDADEADEIYYPGLINAQA